MKEIYNKAFSSFRLVASVFQRRLTEHLRKLKERFTVERLTHKLHTDRKQREILCKTCHLAKKRLDLKRFMVLTDYIHSLYQQSQLMVTSEIYETAISTHVRHHIQILLIKSKNRPNLFITSYVWYVPSPYGRLL